MDALSLAFSALADPTRRAILSRLVDGETHVGELCKPFQISGPAVSRHLRVLEQAGLIERRVNAQWRLCRLRGPGLRAAHDWLARYREFWDQSLDRLVDMLEQPDPHRPAQPKRAASRSATPPRPPSKPKKRKSP